MANTTREIYTVDAQGRRAAYAGYANFDSEGNYLGSRGGYSRGQKATNPNQTSYNENKGGGSRVQNSIKTAGARGRARNPYLY